MRKKGSAWQQELHDSVQNKVSRCIASQQQITQSSLTQPEWMTGKRYLACKRQSWLVEHAHSVNLIIFGDQSLHELRKRTYNGKRRQQVGPQTVSLIYTDMNILLKHDASYCNILAWSFFWHTSQSRKRSRLPKRHHRVMWHLKSRFGAAAMTYSNLERQEVSSLRHPLHLTKTALHSQKWLVHLHCQVDLRVQRTKLTANHLTWITDTPMTCTLQSPINHYWFGLSLSQVALLKRKGIPTIVDSVLRRNTQPVLSIYLDKGAPSGDLTATEPSHILNSSDGCSLLAINLNNQSALLAHK